MPISSISSLFVVYLCLLGLVYRDQTLRLSRKTLLKLDSSRTNGLTPLNDQDITSEIK